LADRQRPQGPILFSIAWYTTFAFLSGLSTSYVMLFAFRGLFGVGMGGMWAAGSPGAGAVAAKHRGIASGILQGGLLVRLPAVVARLPNGLSAHQRPARVGVARDALAGVIPAAVVFWLMTRVPRARCGSRSGRAWRNPRHRALSLSRLFDRDLRW